MAGGQELLKSFTGNDGKERLFELQMVPAEELRKEPKMVNERMRLTIAKEAYCEKPSQNRTSPKNSTSIKGGKLSQGTHVRIA